MPTLKKLLKYTPPDFRKFSHPDHGLPRGLLNAAWHGLSSAETAFKGAEYAWSLGIFPDWPLEERGNEDDMIDMYAGLVKADDMLTRLEAMDPEERKKHLELDKLFDYDKVAKEYADLWGAIAALELEGGDIYQKALDALLKRRIDEWEQEYLPKAEKTDFAFQYGDEMETLGDFCRERSIMEYAVIAINNLRMMGYETAPGFPRLKNLPYFKTYVARLKASDEKFRKILKGRRDIEAWADPTFWWHQPVSEDPKEPKQKRK